MVETHINLAVTGNRAGVVCGWSPLGSKGSRRGTWAPTDSPIRLSCICIPETRNQFSHRACLRYSDRCRRVENDTYWDRMLEQLLILGWNEPASSSERRQPMRSGVLASLDKTSQRRCDCPLLRRPTSCVAGIYDVPAYALWVPRPPNPDDMHPRFVTF